MVYITIIQILISDKIKHITFTNNANRFNNNPNLLIKIQIVILTKTLYTYTYY